MPEHPLTIADLRAWLASPPLAQAPPDTPVYLTGPFTDATTLPLRRGSACQQSDGSMVLTLSTTAAVYPFPEEAPHSHHPGALRDPGIRYSIRQLGPGRWCVFDTETQDPADPWRFPTAAGAREQAARLNDAHIQRTRAQMLRPATPDHC